MEEGKRRFRTVIFYKNYFQECFARQREKARDKVIWTLDLIEELPRVPESYLKHIEHTTGLYEIRIQQGGDSFRIFCFFDDDRLIVLANGFLKKSQKIPPSELRKAQKIKR